MNASPSTHPNDAALRAYGLGKLDDARTATVESHLEECPGCRERVSALSGDSFVDRLRAAGSDPEPTIPDPRSSPAAAEASETGLPAELIQQYELIRVLGRGGMGVVYLARNRLMDRLEALKILNREMLERRGTLDRFVREIRVVAQLNHENVVRAYSALQLGPALVFVLEYVEGMDLARLVKDRGPLPVPHACYFTHQAALGLQHAHERGMVHRDIKPGNLILHKEGQRAIIKVLDFGLAKALSEQSVDTALTHEGQMLGTPDYIAPEQTLDAQKADIRADIYSLGCTLYYMLAGAPPFHGTSLYDILQAHHSMDAQPLNLRRPEVPLELAAVVARMMAKDPDRRFQTPAEVAKALTPFFKKSASAPATAARTPAVATPRLEAPAASVAPASPVPATTPPPLPDPGTAWRSLIDFPKPEGAVGVELAPTPKSTGRGTRRRWLLIASAAGFAAIFLGVIIKIYIKIGRSEDGGRKASITVDAQSTPDRKPTSAPSPSRTPKSDADPVASAPAPATPPEALAASGVELGGGTWKVEGDEIWQTQSQSGGLVRTDWYSIAFGDPAWTQYDFSFETNRYEGIDACGAIFHWLGPAHSRLFAIGSDGGTRVELRDHVALPTNPNSTLRDAWNGNVALYQDRVCAPDRWYRIRVEVRDINVKCYLDDWLVFENSDPRFSHGQIGLGTRATPARFRKIKVTDPSGKVLWEGPPRLPEIPDALRPGTVWKSREGRSRTFVVDVRDGDQFQGRVATDADTRIVRGTIRNGHVRVNAKDVTVTGGREAVGDSEGTLTADALFMSWTGPDRASETYTLFLERDQTSTPAPSPPAAAAVSKPPAQGKTYKVFRDEVGWVGARIRCEQMGGKLAIVKNAEENRFVAQLAAEAGLEHVWLGASDAEREGRWVWVDGTPMLYSLWDRKTGQPNNRSPQGEGEHYLAMVVSTQLWWDQPDAGQVGWKPGFVCQWDGEPQGSASVSTNGFTPLFNGKDLTGWQSHPVGTGKWTVENGILVGRGPSDSHLFTARSNYSDFHARIEAKINADGNSGFCFRTQFFGTGQIKGHGYEANIDATHATWKTGSLMHFGPSGQVSASLVKPDEWFTMDVWAVGKRIVIKVNGQTTIDFVDPNPTYQRGRLAIQQFGARTVASFRKIEIKELNGADGDLRGDYTTLFTAKDTVGWQGLLPLWGWRGRDGVLRGAPVQKPSVHTFLCSRRMFRDFELRFRVRRLNGIGNSGVQFRSTLTDGIKYQVRGPQCEIASADFALPPGSLVWEGGKREDFVVAPRDAIQRAYRDTDYNDFLIRCVGKHVTILVNGVTAVDADVPAMQDEGIIAWQLHGAQPPTIEFRDVVLLDLSKPAPKPER